MRLAVPLSVLLTSAAGAAEDPRGSEVLARAARFYASQGAGGPRLLRIAWLGTADLDAVDQARRPGLRRPERAQDLMLIDPGSVRAALDAQRVGADGTPGLWRHQIVGATGRSINRKSGLTFDRVGPAATHLWQSLAWRLPQLAVAEMQAAPERIVRVTGHPGRIMVLTFEVSPGREVEVSVLPSGEVSGYAYLSERLRGQTRTVTRFKPPVPAPGIGQVPRGYTVDIERSGRWTSTCWMPGEVREATTPGW